MTRGEMFRAERGLAVEVRRRAPPAQDAPSMNGVCEGVIRHMNLPSILVAHTLEPQPGEAVLDMCAAPGGKVCGLAFLSTQLLPVSSAPCSYGVSYGVSDREGRASLFRPRTSPR
jgi:16S rRNA C967 or C1407 C5-methylase (RsmB/RsmF family)